MSSYEENQKKVQTILERGIGILAQNYAVRPLDAGEFGSMITLGTQYFSLIPCIMRSKALGT